jgi:NAD(P)-dependent dehydrogenase (short-subunit alcohol dehydrogenase family)
MPPSRGGGARREEVLHAVGRARETTCPRLARRWRAVRSRTEVLGQGSVVVVWSTLAGLYFTAGEEVDMGSKVALVTGAGSGIGRAVALGLAGAGYKVALAGRRLEPLQETSALAGGGLLVVSTDVTDEAAVKAMIERTIAQYGRLDVVFNNAGTAAPPSPIEELPLETWRRVIDTNLTGVFLVAKAAFAAMKAQDPQGGRIINNGSIAAVTPRPHLVAYTASKHAVTGITKTIALEGRRCNIACSQIDIGNVQTNLGISMQSGTLQADFTLKPEPTFDVKHVADAVLYMAGLPLSANVLNMTVMATSMPYVGRG